MLRITPRIGITHMPKFPQLLLKCLISGSLLRGPEISKFEREFANFIGVKHAICVSSGRRGMEIILKSLRLKKNSEVIMSAYNLKALVPIIENLKLRVKFVDLENSTFDMEFDKLRKEVSKNTKVIIIISEFPPD